MYVLQRLLIGLACLSLAGCWDFGSDEELLAPAPVDELLYPASFTVEMENQAVSLCTRLGSNDYDCEAFDLSGDELTSENQRYRISAFEFVSEQRSAFAPTHLFIVSNADPEDSSDRDPDFIYYVGAGYVVDGETMFFGMSLDQMPEQELGSKEDLLTMANALAVERYGDLDAFQILQSEIVFRIGLEGDLEAIKYVIHRKQQRRDMLAKIGQ